MTRRIRTERPQNLGPYLVYMKCAAPVIWLHAVITATAGSTAELPDRIELSVCTSAISGETLSKEIFSSVKSGSDGAATLCGRANLQQGRVRVSTLVAFMCCLQAWEEMKQTRHRIGKQSLACVYQRGGMSPVCHTGLTVFCLLGEQTCRQ